MHLSIAYLLEANEEDELIINEKTGKIVDIAIRIESDRNIHVKGAKRNGDLLLVPFAKVEKVGEFIIVTE